MNSKYKLLLDDFLNKKEERLNLLETYLKDFTKKPSFKLNDTVECIETVETFYHQIIVENKLEEKEKYELQQSVWTYLGETAISYVGGKWEICDLKLDPAYETPIIMEDVINNKETVRISPKDWETIMFKYNTPKAFSKYLKRLKPKPDQ